MGKITTMPSHSVPYPLSYFLSKSCMYAYIWNQYVNLCWLSIHYEYTGVCVCSVTQLCLTLCNPMDSSLPGSLSIGFSRQEILEWVAIFSFKGSSQPRDKTYVPCISWIGKWSLFFFFSLCFLFLPLCPLGSPMYRQVGG